MRMSGAARSLVVVLSLCTSSLVSASPPPPGVAVAYGEDAALPGAGWELTDVGADRWGNVYAMGTQWWRSSENDPWQKRPCAAKWDASGSLVWKCSYDLGATDYESLAGAVDADGFLYIGGRKDISLYLLMKCAPDGDVVWWKTRPQNDDGYSGNIAITSMRIDGNGDLVCVGYAGGGTAVQAVKYDDDGNELWAHCHQLPGTIARDHMRACGVGANGDVFIGTNAGGETHLAVDTPIVELACFGDYVWLADDGLDSLHRRICLYDPTSNAILRILTNTSALAEPIRGLAWDGAALWVANGTSSACTLRQLDPLTGAELRLLGVISAEVNGLDWGNGCLWYGDATAGEVVCINPATGALVQSVPVPDGPFEVAYVPADGSGFLFVTGTSATYFVEIATHIVWRTLPQWCSPQEGSAWDGESVLVCDGAGLICVADPFQPGAPILYMYNPFNPQDSLVLKLSGTTGEVLGTRKFHFAPREEVVALDGDADGDVVATVWIAGESRLGVVKLSEDLDILWSRSIDLSAPGVIPREVAIGTYHRIYIAGRVGQSLDPLQNGEDGHMFTLCLDGSGAEQWRDVFDAGGPGEKEWGGANSVFAALDGRVTAGGSLSFSGTAWHYGFCVLMYEPEVISTPAVFRLESGTGRVLVDGPFLGSAFHVGSADVAERVQVTGSIDAGDVLEFDPSLGQAYRLAQTRCSSAVAGVVSTQPGVVLGGAASEGMALLALSGIVPVKVTNEGGPIQPGDLLVSSSTPGHAMRWAGPEPCPCALVGKALEAMTDERGVISVLLTAH